jgi:hypothetical protein
MTRTPRLAILVLALAAASTVALGAAASSVLPEGTVAVVAQPVGGDPSSGGGADDGLITVFLPLPPDGFSDGGDVPAGMVEAIAEQVDGEDGNGFSDGGDIPAGLIAVLAQPAPDGFSDGDAVPDGMVAVRALLLGFSDGGDMVTVAMEPLDSDNDNFSPQGG